MREQTSKSRVLTLSMILVVMLMLFWGARGVIVTRVGMDEGRGTGEGMGTSGEGGSGQVATDLLQNCRQINTKGQCISCFPGYALSNPQGQLPTCIKIPQTSTINRNFCQIFNENTGTCVMCEGGYQLDIGGVCRKQLPLKNFGEGAGLGDNTDVESSDAGTAPNINQNNNNIPTNIISTLTPSTPTVPITPPVPPTRPTTLQTQQPPAAPTPVPSPPPQNETTFSQSIVDLVASLTRDLLFNIPGTNFTRAQQKEKEKEKERVGSGSTGVENTGVGIQKGNGTVVNKVGVSNNISNLSNVEPNTQINMTPTITNLKPISINTSNNILTSTLTPSPQLQPGITAINTTTPITTITPISTLTSAPAPKTIPAPLPAPIQAPVQSPAQSPVTPNTTASQSSNNTNTSTSPSRSPVTYNISKPTQNPQTPLKLGSSSSSPTPGYTYAQLDPTKYNITIKQDPKTNMTIKIIGTTLTPPLRYRSNTCYKYRDVTYQCVECMGGFMLYRGDCYQPQYYRDMGWDMGWVYNRVIG